VNTDYFGFGWIWHVFWLSDEKVYKLVNCDSYLHLKFLKYSLIFFSILAILDMTLSIQYAGESEKNKYNKLNRLTIGNLDDNSPVLWGVFAITLVSSVFGYVFLWIYKKKID
jgi:hypothetical protein